MTTTTVTSGEGGMSDAADHGIEVGIETGVMLALENGTGKGIGAETGMPCLECAWCDGAIEAMTTCVANTVSHAHCMPEPFYP